MRKTGLLYDERFLLHCTGPGHPEAAERLELAYRNIEQAGLLDKLTIIKARRAELRWIEGVHAFRHYDRLRTACLLGMPEFDHPDNQICEHTFETALLAVGGILVTIDLVMKGRLDNAFCAVRPPGHHAEISRALGFCYFNNVAITARYLQKEWNVKRIAIVDIDAHHGNGTQQIFDHDHTVFYYSIHEHPSFAYPGTGREFETGSSSGCGFTLNSPVLPGKGDDEYKRLIKRDLFPALESFIPEVILISAGFDAHIDDDMSDINLSTEGYSWIMQRLVELADQYSSGKIISILEGGYCLQVLPTLIKNHIEILLGRDPI